MAYTTACTSWSHYNADLPYTVTKDLEAHIYKKISLHAVAFSYCMVKTGSSQSSGR